MILYLFVALIGLFFLFLGYTKKPPGHHYPMSIKLICILLFVFERLGQLLSHFGASRWKFYRIKPPITPPSSGVQIEKELLGGVDCTLFYPDDFKSRSILQPATIYFHGGGWTLGSVDGVRPLCIWLAQKLDMIIIAPEYRLAPEHPFPASFDDCLNSAKAFVQDCGLHNVGRNRICTSGESAGANLALAVGFEINVRMVAAVSPCIQFTDFGVPSYRENKDLPVLSRKLMVRFVLAYLGLDHVQELVRPLVYNEHMRGLKDEKQKNAHERVGASELRKCNGREQISLTNFEIKALQKHKDYIQKIITDSRMAPLTATDEQMKKLRTTLVVTCQYDVLRDDGRLLIKRLEALKQEVYSIHIDYALHGVLALGIAAKDQKMLNSLMPMIEKITEVLNRE